MASEVEKNGWVCEAAGLSRHFGPLQAVADIGLGLARGEVLALLGPNGAGKTTTLSMLTGNLAPHAGQVAIAGHDIADAPRAAKQALGYLPERPPLYPEMTVEDYLRWCARLRGMRRSASRRAAAEARERTGLGGVGKRLIGHLSKGYQQRVGIAQAIVHRPALVVLDEPTAGLDPIQSRETRELIGSLRAEAGIIFSTHLLGEASALADRIMIIHRGRIAHEARLDGNEATEPGFRLALARPPGIGQLRRVAGVAQVMPRAPGDYLVTASAGADPRENLAAAAIENDWGLLALAPHRPSVEEIFFRIVHAGEEKSAA